MANKYLTTNFYKRSNNAALLAPEKRNPEGKAYIQTEWTAVKKQENTTIKKIVMREVRAKELHPKLGQTREDRMWATAKHLYYIIKGTSEVYEDCATAKIKQKSLQKVAEEHDLDPGEMIFIGIRSQ